MRVDDCEIVRTCGSKDQKAVRCCRLRVATRCGWLLVVVEMPRFGGQG